MGTVQYPIKALPGKQIEVNQSAGLFISITKKGWFAGRIKRDYHVQPRTGVGHDETRNDNCVADALGHLLQP